MSGAPAVSVCVPAYRAERFIATTIESVLAQTFEDWELIIVDDASPDATWDIVRRYTSDPRVRVERNPENVGPVANWNRAVALSRGRYVKLLCSDDVLYPTCLERQVEALDHAPRAGLAAARRDVIDVAGDVVIPGRGLAGLSGRVEGPDALRRMVEIGTTPLGEPSVVLFRAEALAGAGPFRGDYGTLIDVDMYARVLHGWECVAIDETLAAFRVRDGSWSAASHREQGHNLRRLLADLGHDPSLGLPRTAVWRGRLWSYVRAPAREIVFWIAEWRARLRRRPSRCGT